MSDALLEHARQNPPRCIASVESTVVLAEGDYRSHSVHFRIASKNGEQQGKLHGYYLSKLNDEYKGGPLFVSPLSIQWRASARKDEIFDSGKHGYHAESGSNSAQPRGTQESDVWVCPGCAADIFDIRMSFDYYGGADDL